MLSSASFFKFTARIVIFTLVIAMDILLSLPDELCRLVLFDWCFLKDIAKLDQAYLCRTARAGFLAVASDLTHAFAHDLNKGCSSKTQRNIIEWLVSKKNRVKHLSIPVNMQSDSKLLTDLFQASGSSMCKLKLHNDVCMGNYDLLLKLLIKHSGNLQDLSLTEHFPENLDYLPILSRYCPYITKLTFQNCIWI